MPRGGRAVVGPQGGGAGVLLRAVRAEGARGRAQAGGARGADGDGGRRRDGGRVRSVRGGVQGVRQDILPRDAADDSGEEEGDLGHLRVVQEDGRARGRPERVPHLRVGAGPVGVAARGHLRRPALRHARRRSLRHCSQLPHRHPAVQGHDRGDAHGPEEVPVQDLRRALPLLLLRRGNRRADDRAGDGHLAGVQGQDGDRLPGGAGAGPGQPAHQHSQGRRRGCEKGENLSPTGRAGDGRPLRRRHLQRPRHRRVEKLHERPDREGEVVLQAGRGRRHRAQPGEPMAGLGFPAPVPANPGRDRGQRLQQLHQEGLRSQGKEADGIAQGLLEIAHASLFAGSESEALLQPDIEQAWYIALN